MSLIYSYLVNSTQLSSLRQLCYVFITFLHLRSFIHCSRKQCWHYHYNIQISKVKCAISAAFSDDVKLKRISQISISSSASSGVVGLDVSTSSTRSATPPPLPERSDSLTPPEEPHLKTAAWFQAGIPR